MTRPIPGPWIAAAAIVAAEALLAVVGVHSLALSGIALLAPGLALTALLPAQVRRSVFASVAAAPILGFAAVTASLITISWVGIALNGLTIRLVLGAVVVVGAVACARAGGVAWGPARRPTRGELAEVAAVLGVVGLTAALALRVVGELPVPGNDWAKYLLYADEIKRHGSLLIDNPFWMLGVPFREDAAVPASYGAVLIMADAQAGGLAQGILAFTVLEVLAVYAYVRAFWGPAPGVLAAALLGAAPATQGILGWHGLANVAALALLALLLAYLGTLARERLDRPATAGFALVLIGLLATHRLSAIVAAGIIVAATAAAWLAGQRGAPRDVLRAGALAVLLGIGVLADAYARQKTFGGTQGYAAYAGTKLDLSVAARDLSWTLTLGTGVALVALAATRRLDRALWPAVGFVGVAAVLAYSWVVHLPLYYARMVFFLPLAMAPILAVAVWRVRPRAGAALLSVAGVAAIVAVAWPQATDVKRYYAFASPASLRGLDAVAADLRPNEVVVADRCWSFLSTWLLRTRTLAALEPEDIQPQAELPFARMARAILDDSRRGRALVERYGVRYVVLDPTCPDSVGRPVTAPARSTVQFASPRMAILRLNSR